MGKRRKETERRTRDVRRTLLVVCAKLREALELSRAREDGR
jgi:hypothetical protein